MELEFAGNIAFNESDKSVYSTTHWLAVTQYVFNVIHLFINIYFVYGIYATSLIHPNLKTLIVTISLQYSFIAIGRIGQLLNASAFVDKPLVATNCLCIFFKIINDSALFTSCTSVLLLGIERFLATTKKQIYAYKGGKIGYLMLAVTITVGTIFSLSTLFYDMFATGSFDIFSTKTSCDNLFLHPLILPLCWCFAGITFLAGTALLYMLYRYNVLMQKRFINDSLTIRYQYTENISTLEVLIPAVAGYGVMIVLGVAISIWAFVVLIQTNTNSFEVQLAFQILYMIADVYGIYFIAFFFVRFRPMNIRLKKHARWLLKLPMSAANAINPFAGTDPNYVSDFYFKQLAASWDKQAPEPKRQNKMPGKNTKSVYLKPIATASSSQHKEELSVEDK
ncbi:hypothetical protein M3Y97_00317900 [Aphelenchoides bicaudatus]|nr:hypothetical protein M3Y97_00317900 [Aphelenchoides bicaudatus]